MSVAAIEELGRQRIANEWKWEQQLYKLLREMETANGERGDDVEALVRVAWSSLYRTRNDRNKLGAALPEKI